MPFLSRPLTYAVKKYDRAVFIVNWPYSYEMRWVKRKDAYVCQWRRKRSRSKYWSPWADAA